MNELTAQLKTLQHPIEMNQTGLSGPGAAYLAEKAAAVRFLLIGEDHGIGDILRFSQRLFNQVKGFGYSHYVTEIGPISAGLINTMARSADPGLAYNDFYREFGFSIPFATFVEEMELHQEVVEAALDDENPVLGIDQEFFLGSLPLLPLILEENANGQAAEQVRELILRERDSYQALLEIKDLSAVKFFMNQPLPETWGTIRDGYRSYAKADRILEALEASNQIYMHYNNGEYHLNNAVRASLMKRYFYEQYQDVRRSNPDARLLVKLGANHIMRGHSILAVQDIGNALSELAALHGEDTFHLLVLALEGTQNGWAPFTPPEARQLPIDHTSGLASFYQPVLEALPEATGWNLYELAALRQRINKWSGGDARLKQTILGYDAILVMDRAGAATLHGAFG